jgi:hypothetical protein
MYRLLRDDMYDDLLTAGILETKIAGTAVRTVAIFPEVSGFIPKDYPGE